MLLGTPLEYRLSFGSYTEPAREPGRDLKGTYVQICYGPFVDK